MFLLDDSQWRWDIRVGGGEEIDFEDSADRYFFVYIFCDLRVYS